MPQKSHRIELIIQSAPRHVAVDQISGNHHTGSRFRLRQQCCHRLKSEESQFGSHRVRFKNPEFLI